MLSRNTPQLAVALLLLSLSATTGAAPQSPAVLKLLTEARHALGGDAGRAATRSFKITGLIKTPNHSESGSFEIVCALPDRFLQIEHRAFISAGETVSEASHRPSVEHQSTRLGFNGNDVIFEPHVIRTSRSNFALQLTPQQLSSALKTARNGFANLTLGLFAESFAGVPLRFSEATGGDSLNSVQVAGPDVAGTLTFNQQTNLPERFGRIRYDDYREVAGRKVPFRITEGRTEWIVREFLVNVDVTEKQFKPTSQSSR